MKRKITCKNILDPSDLLGYRMCCRKGGRVFEVHRSFKDRYHIVFSDGQRIDDLSYDQALAELHKIKPFEMGF